MSSNPFDGFPFDGNPDGMDDFIRRMGMDPVQFRRMFEDMQRNMQEALRNMGDDPTKGFMAGFNVKMGPDGKPQFTPFGDKPSSKPTVNATPDTPPVKELEREPLTDVIDEGELIAVTMELPGVEKKDLKIHMTENHLEISVDNDRRKYHKRVELPAKVDPSTTKATYNNGVLDVTAKKIDHVPEGVEIQVE